MSPIRLIECPRDAIQGWPHPISTEDKIAYYRTLLDVGFDELDLGSFVSHKAVPQMADTRAVLNALYDEGKLEGKTETLVIVANERGAKDARSAPGVNGVGFPLSLSETFQIRNTGADIQAAWDRLENIQEILAATDIKLVVYLSMGFGNPYNEEWSESQLLDWIGQLNDRLHPDVISLADTIGNASVEKINSVYQKVDSAFDDTSFGLHLHASPWNAREKINAALDAGCTRIDSAIKGIGGCPMAQDELIGNLPTELVVEALTEREALQFNEHAWNQALSLAADLF
ncbi:MAG: hydroxymethylglutaryl-CoA lyase [Bacteroidetes bacterium]|nr:hydroxymethylglutaryl-CoA lyase [Bacteroidota bacterium]MDA1335960.1 hydroxymethylglutaryl-CoA lyase [Bacteroidota bacterium]